MTFQPGSLLTIGSTPVRLDGLFSNQVNAFISFEATGPLYVGPSSSVSNSGASANRGALLKPRPYRFRLSSNTEQMWAVAPSGTTVQVERWMTGGTGILTPGTPVETYAGPVGQTGSWGTPIFEDNYLGSAPDSSKYKLDGYWWGVGKSTNDGNNEKELYLPSQVTVSNGALHLTAIPQAGTLGNKTYTHASGMVTTGPNANSQGTRFEFTYGFIEARMKIPKGKGLWPALWLQQASGTKGWPPEIDVMETLGAVPGTIQHHFHYLNGSNVHVDSPGAYTPSPAVDFTADWHVYGCYWTPTAIRWYVDGVESRTAFTDAARIPSVPLYLLVNLAVGGNWGGDPDASTQFPATVDVDYLKVWNPKA